MYNKILLCSLLHPGDYKPHCSRPPSQTEQSICMELRCVYHNHAVSPLQKNAVMTGIPVPDFEPRYDISPPFSTHLLLNAGP